jgi:hypothetical protein
LFLGIFFFFTYEDVGKRNEVDEANGAYVLPTTNAPAPGGVDPAKLKQPFVTESGAKAVPHGGGHASGDSKPAAAH